MTERGRLLDGCRVYLLNPSTLDSTLIMTALRLSGAEVILDRWGFGTELSVSRLLPLDIVLVDMSLPFGVTGLDVCLRWRRIDGLAALPFVLTASSDSAILVPTEVLAEYGIQGVISKPYSPTILPSQVKAFLNNEPSTPCSSSGGRRPPGSSPSAPSPLPCSSQHCPEIGFAEAAD